MMAHRSTTLRIVACDPMLRQQQQTSQEQQVKFLAKHLPIGDTDVVLAPPSYCATVAQALTTDFVFCSRLSVSGEGPKTDAYGRLQKSRLGRKMPAWTTQRGWNKLKEQWWPPSFDDWKRNQVPLVVRMARKATRTLWVVVTVEYATELVRVLEAGTTGGSARAMQPGECRTFRVPAKGPATWVPTESYDLKEPQATPRTSPEQWIREMTAVVRKHVGLRDTPSKALWTKAARERRTFREAQQAKAAEARSALQQAAARKRSKRWLEMQQCPDCHADIEADALHDAQTGDVFCRKCGLVHTSHQMYEGGAQHRTFEGEKDENHHAKHVDELMSVQTQLETSKSSIRGGGDAVRELSRALNKVDQMMRPDVQSRTDLTTQQTKDEYIRIAARTYASLGTNPQVAIPVETLRTAARIFCNKRNAEVSLQPIGTSKSLQPIGTSKTFRPRDDTLHQHIASSLLAAGLYHRHLDAQAQHSPYIRADLVNVPSWQTKRDGATGTLTARPESPIPLGGPLSRKRRATGDAPTAPTMVHARPLKRRMTNATSLRARAEALTASRQARASA